MRVGKTSLTMGYAGIYLSFLLRADKAAAQFGVDPCDVLVTHISFLRAIAHGRNPFLASTASILQHGFHPCLSIV